MAKLKRALVYFRKKRLLGESTTLSSTDNEDTPYIRAKTPPSGGISGDLHSPHKGTRLKFLSRFGKALGGSSAENSDADDGKRLQNVIHSAKDGWEDLGRVPTHSVWRIFDREKNDYFLPSYDQDTRIRLNYSGHPGDRARDVRARPFQVEWMTSGHMAPQDCLKHPRPVFRASYFCNGVHEAGGVEIEGAMAEDNGRCNCESSNEDNHKCENGEDVGHKCGEGQSEGRKLGPKRDCCPQRAKLFVEVMSDDLSHARVWRQNGGSNHPRTQSKFQIMSHYVRQGVYECAQLRMAVGKIKQRLVNLYDTYNIPKRQCPTTKQVENIVHHSRIRGRLYADPIKAIGIFAEQNPEKIFNFQIHDQEAHPPKKFSTSIMDDYALESLIMFGETNGVAFDSSFQHKNEQHAPVTFFSTVDDALHLVPGTVHILEDVKQATLERFLIATENEVVRRAHAIIEG
ncbi:hypothetical protein FRB94_010074 [Tulasnella sp. JGI-2019a]|nr:hypothetical protein FRB94_010074 [Tulasnella sp. JGI-2019a]